MKSTKSKNKLDVYDAVDAVMNSEDILECANYLLLLSELALQETDRRKVADIFKSRLMDTQFVYVTSLFPIPIPKCFLTLEGEPEEPLEEKQNFFYFSGMNAVQQYLSLHIDSQLTPVKLFKSLVPLAQNISNDFIEPSGRQVSKKFIEDILEYLDNNFDFTNKVYGKEKPIFISIDKTHRIWNSVTAVSKNRNRYHILLYHLKPETEVTPEFVFLHELGHVVHSRYCSSNARRNLFISSLRRNLWKY